MTSQIFLRRTFDESGHYIVKPFNVSITPLTITGE